MIYISNMYLKYIFNYKYSLLYPFLIGISLILAFPPNQLGYAIFISMTIFIIGLEYTKSSFWYGYSFYLGAVITFIGYWFSYYFRLQLGVGYILSYLFTALICFYTALYIGIISLIYSKIKTCYLLFNHTILLPSLWVITELIRGFFFPRSWYALGNTQVDSLLFRGYYPLFGVYFVSWLIVAIAGMLAYCCLHYTFKTWSKCVTMLLIFFGISYWLSGIEYTKPYGTPLTIAMIQPSIFSSTIFNINKQQSLENISRQLIMEANADLIILPETVFGADYHDLSYGYFNELINIANQKRARLILGSPIRFGNNPHKTGVIDIAHPDTPIYLKHYLVPFGEYDPLKDTLLEPLIAMLGLKLANYIPGNYSQPPVEMLNQKFSFNICYENTINDYVATNAKAATIMVNQSDLSWYGKTQMKDVSLQFSQARALENQRYFIQDGNSGDTVIINPKGQIEKKIPAFVSNTLIGTVQGYLGITPFERWQNLPIWFLCCGSLIVGGLLKHLVRNRNVD